jgi:hypothetical protein
MSFFYNLIYNFFYSQTPVEDDQISLFDDHDVCFIKPKVTDYDLKLVTLNPVKVKKPFFHDKINLRNLSNSQLKDILSVKLKPTIKKTEPKEYSHRHPVLNELLKKTKKK